MDKFSKTIFLVLLLLTISVALPIAKMDDENSPCGLLYLTQSPEEDNFLELNWNFTCQDQSMPDAIVLTLNDPLGEDTSNVTVLYKIFTGSIIRGYHKTNVSFKEITFPGNWNEGDIEPDLYTKCFDFYIASVKNNSILYSQCLSIEPAWMSNFADLRIGELMIPGTHNSGAWQLELPVIGIFVLNQNKNFWQQLVYGIRYFDIRIGRYDDGFYINHDCIKCTALLPEFLHVANFIKNSPKEIIILNFHRFPFPSPFLVDYHLELLDLIQAVFEDKIIPYPQTMYEQGPKLSELWESGKNIIISYNSDEPLVKEKDWIWPTVNRQWGDIQDLNLLEDYIKQKTSEPEQGNPMTVLMAELTPTGLADLKDLASLVNKDLAYWIRDGNRSDNLSIIATDFFTGNDVMNVAIKTNFRKLNNLLNYTL